MKFYVILNRNLESSFIVGRDQNGWTFTEKTEIAVALTGSAGEPQDAIKNTSLKKNFQKCKPSLKTRHSQIKHTGIQTRIRVGSFSIWQMV